jgi:hypothetical protein
MNLEPPTLRCTNAKFGLAAGTIGLDFASTNMREIHPHPLLQGGLKKKEAKP